MSVIPEVEGKDVGGALDPVAQNLLITLSAYRFRCRTEEDFQCSIEDVLASHQLPYLREYRLSVRDRIDFLVSTVGLEVKVNGSRSEHLRQLGRYADSPEVGTLILAASRMRFLQGLPTSIHGKPLLGLHLRGVGL